MNFSLIIPNYNGAEFLPDCLNSILAAIKQAPQNNYEIIIIDNGSSDNSISKIKELTKPLSFLPRSGGGRVSPLHEGEIKRGLKNCKLKVIKNSFNLGFAKAVNQGILASQYSWVIPCNNDIRLSPNWFAIMSQTIRDYPNIPAFFGTVLNHSGTQIESQGLQFFIKGKCLNINNSQPSTNLKLYRSIALPIWGGNASLIIYNKLIIQEIGSFDPKFFAYEEDVDLALRLNSAGHHTLLIPQAISYHLGGGTSRKMGYFREMMDAKNWWLIILKNYSPKTFLLNFFPIIEERLRNLSGLIKAIIKTDGLKSIYTLPIIIFKTYSGIFIKYDHWN